MFRPGERVTKTIGPPIEGTVLRKYQMPDSTAVVYDVQFDGEDDPFVGIAEQWLTNEETKGIRFPVCPTCHGSNFQQVTVDGMLMYLCLDDDTRYLVDAVTGKARGLNTPSIREDQDLGLESEI
jgi:hypothetical protein